MAHLPCFWYLICVSFPFAVCQNLSGAGICMPPNSPSIKCCIGYFLEENKCLECEPGFTGENCSKTCPHGYYGRQCNELCHCTPDMQCDPIIGCICNTSSVNCKDSEQIVKEKMASEGTIVMKKLNRAEQSTKYIAGIVLPLLISMVVCLFIGSFCMRMWYVIMKKKREELHPSNNATDFTIRNQCPPPEENELSVVASSEVYNHLNLRVNYHNLSHYYMDNMATNGYPTSCCGLSSNGHLEKSDDQLCIDWHLLSKNDTKDRDELDKNSNVNSLRETVQDQKENKHVDLYSVPNKDFKKKLPNGFAKHKPNKNCLKTVKFNISESLKDLAVHQDDSDANQKEEFPKQTPDKDLYANNSDLAYDNNSFRPDSPLEVEDSDDYFDVSYDEHLAMQPNKINIRGLTTSRSSDIDPDLSEYINCDALDSYN